MLNQIPNYLNFLLLDIVGYGLLRNQTNPPASIEELLQITESLNSLYSSFFNQFTTAILIAGGIIGVLVPLGIAWYQKRQLCIETAKIEKNVKEALDSQMEAAIESRLTTLKKQIDSAFKENAGATCHVQAGQKHKAKELVDALVDYSIAGYCYLECEQELAFQRLMGDMAKCIEEFVTQNALKIERDHSRDIQKFYVRLKRYNRENRNRYLDQFNVLNRHFAKIVPYPIDEKEFE